MVLRVLTHGGAASRSADKDGPERAARRALEMLRRGSPPLDAAVEAAADLEDDPRFNAGTGSNLRFDGKTVEMDASCMDSAGRFGAVTCIRDVKNPIQVARAVMRTPHNLLAGEGAIRFARSLGHAPYDPKTPRAQEKHAILMQALRARHVDISDCPWELAELRALWNFEVGLNELLGSDTVGAVVSDGGTFAAALSTGGVMSALLGRVGDVPLPGCGLHAGPVGAVACTGDGDRLTRVMLAARVYGWLEEGTSPEKAVERAIALLAPEVDVGLIVVTRDGQAGGSNRDMAWAALEEAE